MSKSVYACKALPRDGTEIERSLQEKAVQHSAEGFWKAHRRLRNQGKPWTDKRVYRVYKLTRTSLASQSEETSTSES